MKCFSSTLDDIGIPLCDRTLPGNGRRQQREHRHGDVDDRRAQQPSSPAITGLAGSTTNLQDPTRPFASATVSDPTTGASDTIEIALSGAAGTLSGAGLIANADGSYTLAPASPTTLTGELQALVFTPSPDNGGPLEVTDFALTVLSNSGAAPRQPP